MVISEKILIVDDDINILKSFVRLFSKERSISVATDGKDGLVKATKEGPFALVISDYKMPKMNGLEFLVRIRHYFPDTVRILLTGYANLETAIKAVNDSGIFRLLTKPCPKGMMQKAIKDGIKQYRTVLAEREMLETTVNGAVKVLVEILSLVKPNVFGSASKTARLTNKVVKKLNLPDKWVINTAALLSNLGLLSVPDELVDKLLTADEISSEERELLKNHPAVAAQMIMRIPRLEEVAGLISKQKVFLDDQEITQALINLKSEDQANQILHLIRFFLHLKSNNFTDEDALKIISQSDLFLQELVRCLTKAVLGEKQFSISSIPLADIEENSILAEDIYLSKPKKKLLSKGQELTANLKDYLLLLDRSIGVKQPIKVLIRLAV
jgi:CheY-like chemotaxis protein